jgi:alpha-amylase/alpha-mannosidase (GH57 family)
MQYNYRRPPILKSPTEFSEYVKAFIVDRKGELIGLVLSDETHSFIQFFDDKNITSLIVIDKRTKEVEFDAEVFIKSPKELLNRIYQKMVK